MVKNLCNMLQEEGMFSETNVYYFFLLYKTLSFCHRANSLDPQDAQISMYLALQLAIVRQV